MRPLLEVSQWMFFLLMISLATTWCCILNNSQCVVVPQGAVVPHSPHDRYPGRDLLQLCAPTFNSFPMQMFYILFINTIQKTVKNNNTTTNKKKLDKTYNLLYCSGAVQVSMKSLWLLLYLLLIIYLLVTLTTFNILAKCPLRIGDMSLGEMSRWVHLDSRRWGLCQIRELVK